MAWAGIMADRYTDVHVFDRGVLTGQWYRNEILALYLRLFRGSYRPNFLFMDDNALPHSSQLVDEFLRSEAQRQASVTIDELKSALVHEWV
ncbi:transposable element Tc1 transposase [Trichonephila clavipes]|uniref:Transposable element Tc1 transposase n=1 Tax=Trichonephila clavipes TaxID=2585209 RepID=A0A8X6SA45_TRICX|nr:transposable element Tc1 transposase [Trichonephila clavipes]